MADGPFHCCVCGAEITDPAFEASRPYLNRMNREVPQRCCSDACWTEHAVKKTGLTPVAPPAPQP